MAALNDKDDFRKRPRPPTMYELVDKEGAVRPEKHMTVQSAATLAAILWPDQEQDEDRTGNGWDVQIVGCE